jgi:hypothetical protein
MCERGADILNAERLTRGFRAGWHTARHFRRDIVDYFPALVGIPGDRAS